jgi:hypothetical protein
VRLEGNAAEEGHAVLEAAALPNLTRALDPDEAVRLVVDIAAERRAAASRGEMGQAVPAPGGDA